MPLDFDLVAEHIPSSDRPLYDASIEPAKSHAERALTLASLPMSALIPFLSNAASELQTPWLQSAMTMGAFDFSREISKDGMPSHSLKALNAALDFIKNVDKRPYCVDANNGRLVFDPQDGAGPANTELFLDRTLLTVNGHPEFNAFFEDLVDHLIDALDRSVKDFTHKWAHSDNDKSTHPLDVVELQESFGRLLIGACALDMPRMVHSIVTRFPEAAASLHRLDTMGPILVKLQLESLSDEPDHFKFTPYFFAMQLNRDVCMDAMVQASGLQHLPMGSEVVFNEGTTDAIETNNGWLLSQKIQVRSNQTMDIIDTFKVITPVCTPNILTKALTERLSDKRSKEEGGPDRKYLYEKALQAIGDDSWQDNVCNCFASFLQAGVYDLDTTRSMGEAVAFGFPEVAESIQGPIDWKQIFGAEPGNENFTPVMRGARLAAEHGHPHSLCAALLIAIERAVDEGHSDLVIASTALLNLKAELDEKYEKLGVLVAQPMANMIIMEEFQGPLVAMLKAGLDPLKPLHPGTQSLLEMAESVNHDMVNIIHSFNARKRSMALLDGMVMDRIANPKTAANQRP